MGDSFAEIDGEVLADYEFKQRIGKGAYGIVWQAVNKKSKQTVAVKKIFDAFRNKTDAQRTYREVMFLREFSFHPNVIKLLRVIKADNDLDLYLVLEYMDSDLHNVIKRGNILKDIHQRYIMFQLLNALKCLHSLNVIHRDLKPSNILLDADCRVRVADFGLARSLSQPEIEDESDPTLTEYVATRWYRAPEILLADKAYTTGVDTWSIGCILGEMLLGKPLFPGTSTLNQIEKIMCSINHPTFQDIRNMCSGYALTVLERASNKPKRPIRDMISGAPEDALDLLTRLLVFNPRKRISTEQASEHPYVNRFSSSLVISSRIPSKLVHSISENENVTLDGYRRKLYQLIKSSGLDGHHQSEEALLCNNTEVHKSARSDSPASGESDDRSHPPSPESLPKTPLKSNRRSALHSSTDSLHTNRLIGNWTDQDTTHSATSGRLESSSSCLRKAASQECVRNPIDIVNRDNLSSNALSPPQSTNENLFHGLPPAGLPSHHPRANTSSAWLRYHRGPLISNEIVHHHLNNKRQLTSCTKSVPKDRPKPCYGRKQFGNHSNVSSLGSPKAQMQSYAQSHGTIAASAFEQLRLT